MSELPEPDGHSLPSGTPPRPMRRDCLPHRSGILIFLSIIGSIFLIVSIPVCTCAGIFATEREHSLPGAGLEVPALILSWSFYCLGPAISITVWRLARNDLKQMSAGEMDREGEAGARQVVFGAKRALLAAAIFGFVAFVPAALNVLLSVLNRQHD